MAKAKPEKVWRRMTYGDAVQLVQDALAEFVAVNNLESQVTDEPDAVDVALWNWSRRFVWAWRSPARTSMRNLRTVGGRT